MTRKPPKPGNFIRVETARGFRYLQFAGRHPGEFPMDVMAVVDSPFDHEVTEGDLRQAGKKYFFGTLVKAVMKDPAFTNTGFAGDIKIPTLWRAPAINGWTILHGASKSVDAEHEDSAFDLPIIELIPAIKIISRLEAGWTPEDERSDVSQDLAKVTSAGAGVDDVP